MKMRSECLDCSQRQIDRILQLNKPSPELIEKVRPVMKDIILNADMETDTPPDLAMRIYSVLNEEMSLNDPFLELKDKSNREMMAMIPRLEEFIEWGDDSLRNALMLSAVGNSIDYGIYDEHLSPDEILKQADSAKFAIDHSGRLTERLKHSHSFLMILDNCGEAVFDKLLLDTIRREFPQLDITVAVRGEPVINDITRREAEMIGLSEHYRVIDTGMRHPGIPAPGSDEFEEAFLSADLVLAKGQGNFETERDEQNIFHLFKIKCEVVADALDSDLGGFVLYER